MKVIKWFGKIIGFILLAILILFVVCYGLVAYQTSRTRINYQDEIYEYSEKYNVDPLLTASIIKVESDFDKEAKSNQGAQGLMQLLDETASHAAELTNKEFYPDKLSDVEYNLDLGIAYYDYLYRYYNNRDLALAAYNGGVGNVDKWIKEGILDPVEPDVLNIPFEETRQYVTKIDANYDVYKKFYKNGLPSEKRVADLKQLAFDNFMVFMEDILENFK
ncbi:lytic transglycosylase domain-containing protein [uncultured Anaerococcus sp.]|uniref:lytic transglycosylase domain-containing protein n=1 Tax=uncultured Anaerococcus sp. TaxID=293428 RepID=UPI0026371961|nr:lytic transglycosylase domain-containing protein [uncultured Anaerococcus sp.]